ncbi:Maf family protein [Rhodanobacter lindaniclasticus]|uniref:7-methyl-GTP pyrophosphatase n=1 Tax=Rhodanobacter lindaniclasticus TaxID=75310 RepID=A0A4S3KLK0_9GAMM|nr:Maf family nucleotide pyrophosphatase [Rhodanobacter lindaniclasticus]THD09600.1 septum formation inhibitor Maf [Rhodanobacter lindaniclasticus]
MDKPHMPRRIVLASTSRYRADLLRRLLADFEQAAPDTDETPQAGEAPATRALRLAIAKATAVAAGFDDALVIGSDQVAALDGEILRKPGSVEVAREQLGASSGRIVHFHTALCLLETRHGRSQTHVDDTRVRFRELGSAEIERYVTRELPLDCAGSFKCEGLGISLFEEIDNLDPSALIGLPLIALARMLRQAGIAVP